MSVIESIQTLSDESTTEDSGPSAPQAHSEDPIGPLITFPIRKDGPVLSHRTPPRTGVGHPPRLRWRQTRSRRQSGAQGVIEGVTHTPPPHRCTQIAGSGVAVCSVSPG